LGAPQRRWASPLRHFTWRGWAGGVVQSAESRLDGDGTVPTGIMAAGLGVSETFQQQLGAVVPGHRDVGVSLWRPDLDWRADDATGPALQYLPATSGSLGSATSCVDPWHAAYVTPQEVQLGLVDFDVIVDGNTATHLLVRGGDVGHRRTRIAAAALENRGFSTRLVERAYDEHFHPVAHANPARNEPAIANVRSH
jgi:hypothetical protein